MVALEIAFGQRLLFYLEKYFHGASVTQHRVKALLWKEETLALEESDVNCCVLWKQGGGLFEETAELSLGFACSAWEMA